MQLLHVWLAYDVLFSFIRSPMLSWFLYVMLHWTVSGVVWLLTWLGFVGTALRLSMLNNMMDWLQYDSLIELCLLCDTCPGNHGDKHPRQSNTGRGAPKVSKERVCIAVELHLFYKTSMQPPLCYLNIEVTDWIRSCVNWFVMATCTVIRLQS